METVRDYDCLNNLSAYLSKSQPSHVERDLARSSSPFYRPGGLTLTDVAIDSDSEVDSWRCSDHYSSDHSSHTSPPVSESGFPRFQESGFESMGFEEARLDSFFGLDSTETTVNPVKNLMDPSLNDYLLLNREMDRLNVSNLGHIFHPLATVQRDRPMMQPPMMNGGMDRRSRAVGSRMPWMTGKYDDRNHRRRSDRRSPMSSGARKIPENRICKFFSNGYCNRGGGCNWAHVNIVPTRSRWSNGSRGPVQQMTSTMGGDLHSSMLRSGRTELRGNVYLLARQQEGCRRLQRCLEENDIQSIDIIWKEAIQHVGPLITDPFGHYLWLRLLDRITPAQRLELLRALRMDMVGISLNVHGTRVIQKLLEKVQGQDEIDAAVSALEGEISTLSKDVYGMHVVLRCLYHQRIDNAFIINAVSKRIVSVSMHKHGCCVVQWCLDYGTRAQREGLIDEIARNALELVQDAYGNYVVQQIMDVSKWKSHEDAAARRKVMQALLGNIAKLAVQKFSSIVVEKCLQEADDDIRNAMVEELVDPSRLPRLLQDPYANYVIQKVLSVSRSDEFQRLIIRIRPHLDVLSATPFGKRIQLQMFRKFPILSINNKLNDDIYRIAHE